MKKLIKLLTISAVLTSICFAEQKVVFISKSFEPIQGKRIDTKDLDYYLERGWKIIQISGAGGSGRYNVWAVVIEKNDK